MKFENTVVTFANIPSTANHEQIRRGYMVALAGSDITFTVEDHMRRATNFTGPEWITLQGPGHVKGRTSIHLRKSRYRVVKDGLVLLNRANGMKFPGATRYAKTCRCQDMWTGRFWNLASIHFVPHADEDRRPGVITSMPRGKANVRPAIRSVIENVIPNRVGQELAGGDMNIDLDSDLRIHDEGMVEQLRKAGLITDVQALGPVPDTHGNQEYDWLFSRFTPGVYWVPGSNKTLPKLPGLDHRFRRASVRSSVRHNWKIPAGYSQ